ncbi:hypothetical protein [Pararhizobium gei]|uniref:hypothetical protein n=1 Tax=Pararhizobium gei TaxID=1395951 RepID=UPI0023DA63C7|nr:hypothetical protein [Rhizobium gei]
MKSQFNQKVQKLRELEGGFCNPLKNKFAEETRQELHEDLERRGFDKNDIAEAERDW